MQCNMLGFHVVGGGNSGILLYRKRGDIKFNK